MMTSMIMINSNGCQLCQQRKRPEWQQYDWQVDNKDKDGQLPIELNMEPVRSYHCFKAWFKFLFANLMIDGDDAQVRLDCPNRTAVTVSYYSQVRQSLHALKISLRLDLSHDNHLMVFFFFTSSSSSSTLESSSSASPPSSSASGKSQDPWTF